MQGRRFHVNMGYAWQITRQYIIDRRWAGIELCEFMGFASWH